MKARIRRGSALAADVCSSLGRAELGETHSETLTSMDKLASVLQAPS